MVESKLAPVPRGYYDALQEAEERHWWHRGMREITRALVADRMAQPGLRALDAGCGTGGFLAWLRSLTDFARLAGVDASEDALAFAETRASEVELRQATISAVPFEERSFDLVFLNDVLQHVHEDDEARSLRELRRVLVPSGALLVRAAGTRRAQRMSPSWRTYDRATLSSVLEREGFRCEWLTYANVVGSLWAVARGRPPAAPTDCTHGIPTPSRSRPAAWLKYRLLLLEARYLRTTGRALPWGHTLFALATPVSP